MSKRSYRRMLPQNVREAKNEALDLGLKDSVYTCNKCRVFLLNREAAFNHKTCTQISPSESKNVTVPKKPIVLKSIQRKLRKIDNNKTDGAAKNYGDFPSTSNDTASVIEPNKQQTSLPINEELDDQLTECGKKPIDKQSKLIKTSTSQEALLDFPTTSTFTEEESERINEQTLQYKSCYRMVESLKNNVKTFNKQLFVMEKKATDVIDKAKKVVEEKKYLKSLYVPIKNEKAVDYNHISKNR